MHVYLEVSPIYVNRINSQISVIVLKNMEKSQESAVIQEFDLEEPGSHPHSALKLPG